MRRGLIIALLGVLAIPVMPARSNTSSRPNVLIIQTDDQNVSRDGYAVMDATMALFRTGGTEFRNAIATTPLCCPSRAATFSGRYVHNNGVTGLDNPESLDQTTTIQYQLRRSGYTTAHVGKYLNSWAGKKPHFDYVGGRTGYYTSDGTYGTTVNRNAAIRFLKAFESADVRPWLMFVNVFAPHEPAIPEPKYADAPVPPFQDNPATLESEREDKPAYVRSRSVSRSRVTSTRADQLRTLMSVDDLVEQIFQTLQALGEDNTLAVFMSDNGYMWLEHKLNKKRHIYDASLQIPLFLRWPNHVAEGAVDPRVSANIDIAPTIYDAAGITPSYAPDGRSLLRSWDRQWVLAEHWSGDGVPTWKALWSPTETYAEYSDGFKEYYAPDDPWQLTNLYRDGIRGNEPSAALGRTLATQATCKAATCS